MYSQYRKILASILVLSTLAWAFGLMPLSHVPQAHAADIGTSALVNTFILSGATIKASSAAIAVLGLNLANGTGRTLNAVQVTVAGPTGFDPATELAAAATGATSGVALYKDGTATGSNTLEDGVFVDGANGDAVVTLSGAPTYSAATRASALTPTLTATIVVAGTSAIAPSGTYTTPAVGDIVFYQSTTTAGVWANVTNATLTSGTFAVNGAALAAGTYRISKLGGGAGNTLNVTTGASGANAWTVNSGTLWSSGVTPVLGDIVQFQTGTSAPTWGVVTNATSVNQNTFAINGANLTAATAYQITKISSFTPATSAVDASVAGKLTQGLTFAVGDLVIGTTGSGYVWGIVTTAETVAATGTVSALRINGASATSLFSTSTQVSKITASGTGLATAATPTITAGDVVFANPVLNAAPVAGYNFHVATTGGAGPAGTALRLDGGTAAAFWPYTTTLTPASTPTIPADNTTAGNVGSDFYIVGKSAATPTNGKQFNVSIRANADVTISNSDTVSLASLPTNTNTITVDTVAPTVDVARTGPPNNATGVPISAVVSVHFNEALDQSTINPTNVTFCSVAACGDAGAVAVASGLRSFPDGFDVVVSAPPTFAASSRFAKVGSTTTAFYHMMGSNTISPQPPSGYSAPTAGDIVITQRETFPPEVGLITDATLTSGTFALNGFPAFGGQQITRFVTAPAATSAVDQATAVNLGDIIVANTATFPTSVKYDWHIVSVAANINGSGLRLDSLGSQPTFNTHPGAGVSRFSSIAPSATATDNGSGGGQVLAVSVGDMVFIQIGSSYGWHLVTSAGNLSSDATENTAFIDGGVADPAIAASSQMSRLAPGAEGAVTATTAVSTGDIVLAKTTANASNNNSYAFHMVSGADTIANAGGALRFDNFPGSLTPSTTYFTTTTTGVKDLAGNQLTAGGICTVACRFTTGSTGGTNTTPPFVQSSQPQSGSQNHPINAPIKLTFSVDMASSGGGSITDAANVGLFTDNFGAPGTAVSTTKTYSSATKELTFAPISSLTASTGYVIKVNTTATSTTGTPLNSPSTQPYFLSFKTPSGAADTTAPTVLGVSPACGATEVSPGAVITAGFSEDMDPATIISGRVKLALTSDLAATVTGNVTYNPSSRSASFAPSTALTANTGYTFTVVSGASGVKDLSSNQLAANSTCTFTVKFAPDTVKPFISFSNADNFSAAVTFNETMKSGGGPNAADNIANFTLESPVGSTIGLGGKTVTYEAGTKTARITGLSLQNGNNYKITAATTMQDLSSNTVETTGTPAANTSFGMVQDSTSTGGQIGPGTGTIDPGMQGMNPTRVTPMVRSAGGTSTYHIELLASTSIPSTGQIVLTFPAGFTLSGAAAVAVANSFCNADLNGPATGAPTIGAVAADNDSGTITITTATAATGTNSFLCMDVSGVVNSTVPSSSGYTVTLQTKDTAVNNRATLQTLTASPFFLGSTGSRTLTVNVFKDANSNNVNNASEGINGVTVYLFSPASGGQEATTANSTVDGVATFTSLADGDYMVGIKPNASIDVAFNSAPQPISISANTTKNFALSSAAALTISGTITGTNGTKVDIFASSNNGFTKKTVTLTGGADAYSLPVSPNSTYNVGVGPAMPESFFTPGAPPPPPPDFTFMPPPNVQVAVASASVTQSTVTGLAFSLTTASKTITGTVLDSAGSGVSNSGVFCRPMATSTTGTASGFGTGAQTNSSGAFTVKVTPGVYLCGVFKPGMPHVSDKQITVPASGANTPASLAFVLDASTSLSITGTVKDDSGNAIPYAGVGGRKVTSSSDTTPIGGDSGNFIGGPTDANGAYTLYVTAGTWVIEAFAPGFGKLGTKTVVVATSNLTGQDFSAQTLSLGTITGTATRAGTVVQGAMVRAEGASGGNMVITGSDGTYSMRVPAGTYTLKCFFPGVGESTPLTNVVVVLNTTTSAQNCTLAAPITITVNLTDGTNAITGAFVDVRDSNGRGNGTDVSATSGANAVYTVSVPPGTYSVRAGHPSYGMIGFSQNISTTQAITYTATAGRTYAVTGTVVAAGSGVNGAWVSVIGTPAGQANVINLGAQTDSTGAFSLNIPSGSYVIRADKPGYKSPAAATLAVGTAAASAGSITLVAATQTITGTVGSGLSNAFVSASDTTGGFAVAQSDTTGAYSLAVTNGTWSLTARSIGFEGTLANVVVNNNNPSSQNITMTALTGFTVSPEKQETVTPTSGGFLTNSDIGGNFRLSIPANALGTGSNAATLKTQINTGLPNPPNGSILSKNAVTISAVDSSGQPIKNLNDSITVVVPYDATALPAGASESGLVLGVWNDATQAYDTLSTTVDTVSKTLTATVDHLSDFAPIVSSTSGATSTPASSGGGGGGGGGGSYSPTPSPTPSPVAVAPTPSPSTGSGSSGTSTPAPAGAHPNGTLVLDGKTVYLIKNGKRLGFRNEREYLSHGYKFSQAVPASAADKALPAESSVAKAMEGTLVIDASDNRTVYMIGTGGVKRGFTSMAVLKALGYNLTGVPKINVSDYPAGPAIGSGTEAHPDGALVKEGKTIWWIKGNQKVGFESMAVFNTYGFKVADVTKANVADVALAQGPIVKFRDGTLVKDGNDYYLISDGKKLKFASSADLTTRGYKTSSAIKASLAPYESGGSVQ